MTKINLKINNIPVQAEPGSTILEAAREAGIQIPTLCYLKDVNKTGACRVCTVEIKSTKAAGTTAALFKRCMTKLIVLASLFCIT